MAFSGAGGFSVGKVVATARCYDAAFAIVEQWDITAKHDSGSIRCIVRAGSGISILLSSIIEPLFYSVPVSVGSPCTVLVPVSLKHLLS